MTRQQKLDRLKKIVDESMILRRSAFERLSEPLLETADVIAGVIGSGGKILTAGNGDMAALSSNFAASMIGRLSRERKRQALPVVALTADAAVLTGAAADFGYQDLFVRQIEALGHKGDLLMVLSCDGNCANLVPAVRSARDLGLLTLGLLGGNGGKLGGLVDRSLIVPHPTPQRVQEEHLLYLHMLTELIEYDLFA